MVFILLGYDSREVNPNYEPNIPISGQDGRGMNVPGQIMISFGCIESNFIDLFKKSK